MTIWVVSRFHFSITNTAVITFLFMFLGAQMPESLQPESILFTFTTMWNLEHFICFSFIFCAIVAIYFNTLDI